MPTLMVFQGDAGTGVWFEGTPVLSAVLQAHGYPVALPCGGKGVCGHCRVSATGAVTPLTPKEQEAGSRLACQTRVLGDASVTLPLPAAMENIAVSGERPAFALQPMHGPYGLAVDIGTTTLAASLLSLTSGEPLAAAAAENPQRGIAADVIGRMEAAMAGQAQRLQTLVTQIIAQLRGEVCARGNLPVEAIGSTVITGNTTMLYLLCGQSPEPLSHAPFIADRLFGEWMPSPDARTYLPRCVSAFIGADITCGILAAELCRRPETALLVDVGTNGEMALWHRGRLYACATAAGPAFEGGGLAYGCGSIPGAIDRVWTEDGRLACSTIANKPSVGICGSGVLDAVAALLRLGLLDETGALGETRVALDERVFLTQKDVRNVQLAKSAIAAGMLTLCQTVGVRPEEITALYLAGGFGRHLDLQNAAEIGLIPQALAGKTKVIGNAALAGAEMLLLQTDFLHEVDALARSCQVVTLSGNPAFSENYMQCMMLDPI